jgi:hypothetical protein
LKFWHPIKVVAFFVDFPQRKKEFKLGLTKNVKNSSKIFNKNIRHMLAEL